jgi:mannose-1-phosphate guanylyltransferase
MKYQTNIYNIIKKLEELDNIIDIYNLAIKLFDSVDKISIDYAILEKTNKAYVIEAALKWSDVGTYLYLEQVLEKDEYNNVVKNTQFVGLDSNNNIIISDNDTNINVNLLGVNNCIISVTKENILIINKNDINKMKELMKKVDI